MLPQSLAGEARAPPGVYFYLEGKPNMSVQVLGMSEKEGKTSVTLESDKDGNGPENAFPMAITELQSGDTRKMAIAYATRTGGVSNARCEMPSHPYPVDGQGDVVVNPREQTVYRYRVDVPISQGLP